MRFADPRSIKFSQPIDKKLKDKAKKETNGNVSALVRVLIEQALQPNGAKP